MVSKSENRDYGGGGGGGVFGKVPGGGGGIFVDSLRANAMIRPMVVSPLYGAIAMHRSDASKLSLWAKSCDAPADSIPNARKLANVQMIFTPQRCTVGIEANGV